MLLNDGRRERLRLPLFVVYFLEDLIQFLLNIELSLADSTDASSFLLLGIFINHWIREALSNAISAGPFCTKMACFDVLLFLGTQ